MTRRIYLTSHWIHLISTGEAHPTLPTPELALSVLDRFSAQFVSPQPSEGYDSLVSVTPDDAGPSHWGKDEILAVLEKLRESTRSQSRRWRGGDSQPGTWSLGQPATTQTAWRQGTAQSTARDEPKATWRQQRAQPMAQDEPKTTWRQGAAQSMAQDEPKTGWRQRAQQSGGTQSTSDRKSTRLNSSHSGESRMPSSA